MVSRSKINDFSNKNFDVQRTSMIYRRLDADLTGIYNISVEDTTDDS